MKEKREVGYGEKTSFKYEDTSPLTQRQFTQLKKQVTPTCEYQELQGKEKTRE